MFWVAESDLDLRTMTLKVVNKVVKGQKDKFSSFFILSLRLIKIELLNFQNVTGIVENFTLETPF